MHWAADMGRGVELSVYSRAFCNPAWECYIQPLTISKRTAEGPVSAPSSGPAAARR